jgi:23S rRNA (cytidine1920-2'-O)/16S rRNA (cytidine1409-2'-O)-methyltransferase
VVRDATVHERVVSEVAAAAAAVGLTSVGVIESPITGAEGNREFLMHVVSGVRGQGAGVRDQRVKDQG